MQPKDQELQKITIPSSLDQQTLEFVIDACQQESRQAYEQEKGYCFELLRRALEEDCQAAWAALQKQYERLIIDWLRRAANGALTPDEVSDLLQDIYTKFWLSLKKQSTPLSTRFAHIGAILKYLNRCTLTTFLDVQRRSRRQNKLQEQLARLSVSDLSDSQYEDKLEENEYYARLSKIEQWIQTEVTDSLEQLVLTLLYTEGLKPREIVARYPDQFSDTYHVRQIKTRVLQRARRALASNVAKMSDRR